MTSCAAATVWARAACSARRAASAAPAQAARNFWRSPARVIPRGRRPVSPALPARPPLPRQHRASPDPTTLAPRSQAPNGCPKPSLWALRKVVPEQCWSLSECTRTFEPWAPSPTSSTGITAEGWTGTVTSWDCIRQAETGFSSERKDREGKAQDEIYHSIELM
ncbi:rCG40256 [Rattus norvegicus]|uniref:RCG40256 n=1 Tax=Rattus norvegicus TaxID=10116 RepID=A6I8U3_RAT|nr:rCG40256 [Rattus norvegicus]